MELKDLRWKITELLSDYGVDRAGIEEVMDIAIEYGEGEYDSGYEWGKASEYSRLRD